MKKFVAILLLITAAGVLYYYYQQYTMVQDPNAGLVRYETVSIEEGKLVSTIYATGKVRSKQSTSLYWKTSGIVDMVFFEVDDQVETGDLLASLLQTSLPQSVILAQADLVNAQTELADLYTNAENAQTSAMNDIATYAQAVRDAQYQLDNYTIPTNMADLDTMEALDLMKAELDAVREAFEPYKYFSTDNETRQRLEEDLNEAQSNYNAAVKRLDYEYELEVALDNLEKARSDFDKWAKGPNPEEITAVEVRIAAAEAILNQAWIEAPFSGSITKVIPLPGDQVDNNTEAFRIDDLSTLFVDLQVSEIDISLIEIGQNATMTFDAIRGAEYRGVVTEIGRIGTESQGGVVNFTVTLEMIDPDENVLTGMTSEVEIVVSQREQAILVPNQAVRYEEGAQVVYILSPGNELTPVTVELGISSEVYSELLSGELQVGDEIVVNPDIEITEDLFSGRGPMRPPWENNEQIGGAGDGGQP